jgi:hypothetical protein
LGCKPWYTKKNICCVDECTMLLEANFAMAKNFDQLFLWKLIVHYRYYSKIWLICYVWPSI